MKTRKITKRWFHAWVLQTTTAIAVGVFLNYTHRTGITTAALLTGAAVALWLYGTAMDHDRISAIRDYESASRLLCAHRALPAYASRCSSDFVFPDHIAEVTAHLYQRYRVSPKSNAYLAFKRETNLHIARHGAALMLAVGLVL